MLGQSEPAPPPPDRSRPLGVPPDPSTQALATLLSGPLALPQWSGLIERENFAARGQKDGAPIQPGSAGPDWWPLGRPQSAATLRGVVPAGGHKDETHLAEIYAASCGAGHVRRLRMGAHPVSGSGGSR
jgi:hypothetical protein